MMMIVNQLHAIRLLIDYKKSGVGGGLIPVVTSFIL
jgi:hypothetical protein